MSIIIKRAYDEPGPTDGYRVLVDRLWPRGISKERAQLDEWFKDIAPSQELRVWFGHKSERYEEFKVRYELELDTNPAIGHLKEIIKGHSSVALIYGARDPQINHARVLAAYLKNGKI